VNRYTKHRKSGEHRPARSTAGSVFDAGVKKGVLVKFDDGLNDFIPNTNKFNKDSIVLVMEREMNQMR
jgi:hypothetical protein